MRRIISLILLLFYNPLLFGQLGFCSGSKGNPIFFENFGSGTNFGPPLPIGTTSYTYVAGPPNDGQYTLHYNNGFNATWHNATDHTFDDSIDGLNGKALLVNASYNSGEFYKRAVGGLCVNTTFEFSAWVMNVYNAGSSACSGTGIPIDVTFEIWDASETTLLKTGSTGPIVGTNAPIWKEFGLVFTTGMGQTAVVLKMRNNGAGGCGNDLAIDDIAFRSCGDFTTIASPAVAGNTYSVCENQLPISLPLTVVISNLTPHVFQWQESADNITWTDLLGENAINYNVSNLTLSKFFRVKVAQDAANLANPFCVIISEPFIILVLPQPAPPFSSNDKTICSNEALPSLTVAVPTGISVDWYDAATGGNIIQASSISFTPNTAGIFYAEAVIPNKNCKSASRTAVQLTIHAQPVVTDQDIIICENQSTVLDADLLNVGYEWSTGETTKTIIVHDAGIYTVKVTSPENCSNTKTIVVTVNTIPEITEVTSDNGTVTIFTSVPGNYEYSLDNIIFQDSNIFTNVPGGLKTSYVRDKFSCGSDSQEFLLIVFPKYFTPNGDGYQDRFEIVGLDLLHNATLSIFDRFGKLLKLISSAEPYWNGTLNGFVLPASDYWYRLTIDDKKEFEGHFTLKR